MIRVQVIGDEALIAKLEASKRAVEAGKPQALRNSGMAIKGNIQGAISKTFQQRTHDLFNSVRLFYQTKNGISIGTGQGLDYVWPLEFGARPHEIVAGGQTMGIRGGEVGHYGLYVPGGASMLHFINSEGEEVFTYRVSHPGNRPYRFIYAGTLNAMPQVYGYWRRLMATALGVKM